MVNFVTEPITAEEVYFSAIGAHLPENKNALKVSYDIHSKYANLFNKDYQKYLYSKETVLSELVEFIRKEQNKI